LGWFGKLAGEDAQQPIKQFDKDTRMLIHSAAPINLETPLALLADAITPHERFFMCNNSVIPTIAPATKLCVPGIEIQS
jgi:hypothetical protein